MCALTLSILVLVGIIEIPTSTTRERDERLTVSGQTDTAGICCQRAFPKETRADMPQHVNVEAGRAEAVWRNAA
jgi:hypothetical protein